ncbi:MAG: IPT/TIG domain-containing protein [Myxococcota bacterium]
MRTSLSALVVVALLGAPGPSEALIPPQCGPDCMHPGTYVICNDSLDNGLAGSGVIGLNSFEWTCSAFAAPSASSYDLLSAWAAYGPTNGGFPTFIEVRAYANGPGGTATPGTQIMPSQNGNLSIPFNNNPALVSLSLSPTYAGLSGPLRLCLLNGADDSDMGILYDGDGIQTGLNYQHRAGHPWEDAASATPPVPGDFAIRAVVHTSDMGPWTPPSGVCVQPAMDGGVQADSGVTPDAGVLPDSGPSDLGVAPDAAVTDAGAPLDGAVFEDAMPAPDAGASADATSAEDAAFLDATGFADAAQLPGDDAGSTSPAPTVTSISPNSGSNAVAIDVVVSGTGFAPGATLRIGAIPTTRITVPGPSTLLAQVPPGIIAGKYDVVVQNPDGQAAVLVKGYEVVDPAGQAPTDGGCGCSNGGSPDLMGITAWIGAFLLRLGRRRAPGHGRPPAPGARALFSAQDADIRR